MNHPVAIRTKNSKIGRHVKFHRYSFLKRRNRSQVMGLNESFANVTVALRKI